MVKHYNFGIQPIELHHKIGVYKWPIKIEYFHFM